MKGAIKYEIRNISKINTRYEIVEVHRFMFHKVLGKNN